MASITGIGTSRYGNFPDRTALSLAVEAVTDAVTDAALSRRDVAGVVTYGLDNDVAPHALASALGLTELDFAYDFRAGGVAVSALLGVVDAILAAQRDTGHVVVYRAVKGRSGHRYGGSGRSRIERASGESQYTAPHGWTTYAEHMAMWASQHRHRYGTKDVDYAAVVLTQRAHAQHNSRAVRRTPLTLDEYLGAEVLVDPFRRHDMCVEVDGACALVVSRDSLADTLRWPRVRIAATAQASLPGAGSSGHEVMRLDSLLQCYAALIASRLFERSGVSRTELCGAQLYDSFSHAVLLQLESFGICPPGESGEYVRSGNCSIGGVLPTNTGGGMLAEGYLHGMNQYHEAVVQLRGAAGARQIPDAWNMLVSSGATSTGSAALLVRDAA